MSGDPLDANREIDSKVIECYENRRNSAFSEGALSPKVKLLIAIAIDAEHGAVRAPHPWGRWPSNLESQKKKLSKPSE
jgi:alkylhydroperoxidase/carboxymuconolactone decarboxylase family protein YurZ